VSLLTKEAILAAEDRKSVDVPVPEWGGTVRVATIPALEQDRWVAVGNKNGEMANDTFRIQYVALCCVDENGSRLFSTEDVAALGEKSSKAIQRVFEAASTLNGLSEAAISETEKNSKADQSDGSSSESPGV
jgi:hypothetical protein